MQIHLSNIRALSDTEKTAIPTSIAAGIDLDKVEIHNRKWMPLTPTNTSVVRGYKIFYPNEPGHCTGIHHLAHLVHEVVHIWQYNYLGVGLYSPRWLDRRYHYDLNEGDHFQDFGLEQQASIVEDLFRIESGLPSYRARNSPPLALFTKTVTRCSKRPISAYINS